MKQHDAEVIVLRNAWHRSMVPIKAQRFNDDDLSECMYRVDGDGDNTDPTNCCFLGVSILPKQYRRSLEYTAPLDLQDRLPDYNPIKYCRADFLTGLQGIHDKNFPHQWHAKLIRHAEKYGITPEEYAIPIPVPTEQQDDEIWSEQ